MHRRALVAAMLVAVGGGATHAKVACTLSLILRIFYTIIWPKTRESLLTSWRLAYFSEMLRNKSGKVLQRYFNQPLKIPSSRHALLSGLGLLECMPCACLLIASQFGRYFHGKSAASELSLSSELSPLECPVRDCMLIIVLTYEQLLWLDS